jgi:multiple sugar transport system permease protein
MRTRGHLSYGNIFRLVIGWGSVIALMFPLYWMVVGSLATNAELYGSPPAMIPTHVDLSGWHIVLHDNSIRRYFLNSLIVASATSVATLCLTLPAAFALAHLRVKGAGLIGLLSFGGLLFPSVLLATPMFVIFANLHLLNTYWALILCDTALTVPFILILMRPLFLSIPRELTDAALVDGATLFGAFRRVVLPLAAPAIVAGGVLAFLFTWGELVFALTMTSKASLRPVSAGLWVFVGLHGFVQWNGIMAMSCLTILPPLMVFLVAQRYVVGGLTAGALKG